MRILLIISIILLFSSEAEAQKADKRLSMHGYMKTMQTVWIDTSSNWTSDNLLHNRLNFAWKGKKGLNVALEMRNRLLFGELVSRIPDYGELLETDRAWFDLSRTISSGPSHVLHTCIDRAFVDYSTGKWQFTLGRQRINWGQNLVWNPNDLFNAFSFFDFDYEERPGTDAIRIQRYTGPASVAELVVSGADSLEAMGFAGRYLGNFKGYDWQLLGGWVKGDRILGLGWSGDIKGAGFRGEGTAFWPGQSSTDSLALYVVSVSADYTFSKGLYIHGAVLYNSRGNTGKAGGYNILMANELSAKLLSPARWSLLFQMSHSLSPLISANIAAIANPNDRSAFIGPALSFSLSDEADVMFSSQIFMGDSGSEFGDYGSLWFLRLKWSF
jgi:hypothetical protein